MPNKTARTLAQVFGGILAAQTGVMAGEQQARARDLQEQELQRRRQEDEQNQLLRLFSMGAQIEERERAARRAPYERAIDLSDKDADLSPLLGALEGHIASEPPLQYGSDQFRAMTGGAGAQGRYVGPQQPLPPSGGAPRPAATAPLPIRTAPGLKDAYQVPIQMRERALAVPGIDPSEGRYIALELEGLRKGLAAGLPLSQAQVFGGSGFGHPVRASLPAFKLDKSVVGFEGKRRETVLGDLKRFVAQYPQGSEERKLAEERVAPYLGRLEGLKLETQDDLEAARSLYSDPDLTRLRFSSNAGTETLADRKRRDRVTRHQTGVDEFLGGPTKAPLPPNVARHQLPARLDIEKGLLGGDDGVSPFYASEERAIERVRAINKAIGEQGIAPEERARLEAEGDQVTEGIQQRLRAGLSPATESSRFEQGLRALGTMSIADARGGEGQAVFESLGIPHLWKPGLSGARADKMFDELMAKAPSFAKLTPEGQALYLDRLKGASRLTGRPIDLPADFVLKLSPTDASKLAMERSRLALQGEKLQVAKAHFRLDQAEGNFKLSQRGGKIPEGAKMLLLGGRRQVGIAQKDYTTALTALRKTGDSFWAAFDPEEASQKLAAGEPLTPSVSVNDPGFWGGVDSLFAKITGGQTKAQRAQSALATREQKYSAVAQDLIAKWKKWQGAEQKYTSDLNAVAGGAGVSAPGAAKSSAAPGSNRAKFEETLRQRKMSPALIKEQADLYYPAAR